jgi:outer membrane lipoprotein-sorting protein
MKMKHFFAIAAAMLAFGQAFAPSWAESPAELLERIEELRSIPDMRFEIRVTSFEDGKQKDYNRMWGFVKSSESADNRILLYFAEPASVKGRKMLMDGSIVYLLFPRTRNPIRLSPLQVLLGEASNGDVARTVFSKDYDVASLSEVELDGAPCYLFKLKAKESKKDSTYRSVALWVEKSKERPVYTEFSAADGKLLKKAYYKDYGPAEGKDFPYTMDIYDGENPQKHTMMTYSKISSLAVRDTVFSRDYLGAWSPAAPK